MFMKGDKMKGCELRKNEYGVYYIVRSDDTLLVDPVVGYIKFFRGRVLLGSEIKDASPEEVLDALLICLFGNAYKWGAANMLAAARHEFLEVEKSWRHIVTVTRYLGEELEVFTNYDKDAAKTAAAVGNLVASWSKNIPLAREAMKMVPCTPHLEGEASIAAKITVNKKTGDIIAKRT